jgi:hypothetical protein
MNNLIITNSDSDLDSNSESESEYSDSSSDNILTLHKEYSKINTNFTNIYNSEYKTINILVDTYGFKKTPDFNTSDYVYHLNLTDFSASNINNLLENNTGGFDKYTNVIGFRLVKAVMPNTAYTINNSNDLFVYKIGDEAYKLELTQGYYEPCILTSCLPTNPHDIKFNWENGLWKYNITSSSKIVICWDYNEKTKNLAGLLGYYININLSPSMNIYGNMVADLASTYVDLVIDEIPSIACKQNSYGRRIIDRIPLNDDFGDIKYYEPEYKDKLDISKLFFPITLDKLSIKLYDKNQGLFDNQQGNHTFEFELTIKN